MLPFAVVDLSSIVKHTKGAVEDIRLRKRSVTERSAMDISEGMHLIVCSGIFCLFFSIHLTLSLSISIGLILCCTLFLFLLYTLLFHLEIIPFFFPILKINISLYNKIVNPFN